MHSIQNRVANCAEQPLANLSAQNLLKELISALIRGALDQTKPGGLLLPLDSPNLCLYSITKGISPRRSQNTCYTNTTHLRSQHIFISKQLIPWLQNHLVKKQASRRGGVILPLPTLHAWSFQNLGPFSVFLIIHFSCPHCWTHQGASRSSQTYAAAVGI